MDLLNHSSFLKYFSAFSIGSLIDVVNVLSIIHTKKINIDDFIRFVEEENQAALLSVGLPPPSHPGFIGFSFLSPRVSRPCPACGALFVLSRIDIPQGKNNVFNYKSKWFCHACLFEEFSTLSAAEAAEQFLSLGGGDGSIVQANV